MKTIKIKTIPATKNGYDSTRTGSLKFNGKSHYIVDSFMNFIKGRTSITVSDKDFVGAKPLFRQANSNNSFARYCTRPEDVDNRDARISVCRPLFEKFTGINGTPSVIFYKFGRKSRSKIWSEIA